MVQQASDRDRIINHRSRIYANVSCFTRHNPSSESCQKKPIAFLICQTRLQIFASHVTKTTYRQLLWQNIQNSHLGRNILQLNTIISEAKCKRPSTSQETSRSSIFPQSYSLQTLSLNLWTMKASSDAAICYVAGDTYYFFFFSEGV